MLKDGLKDSLLGIGIFHQSRPQSFQDIRQVRPVLEHHHQRQVFRAEAAEELMGEPHGADCVKGLVHGKRIVANQGRKRIFGIDIDQPYIVNDVIEMSGSGLPFEIDRYGSDARSKRVPGTCTG